MSQNTHFSQPTSRDAVVGQQFEISSESGTIGDIKQLLHPLRQQLLNHEVYQRIQTLSDLRVYMEHHVFAVWDFMSLLKALQGSLTCIKVPWLPTANPLSRRLINEIVLGEESDTVADGVYGSHFEIYLSGMVQCGADTGAVEDFLRLLRSGASTRKALRLAPVPKPAESFVRSTWRIIETRKPHMIAAAFALGREEVIPDRFRSLAGGLQTRFPNRMSIFSDYLERHITLDGDHHSPMALAMLRELCGEDLRKQEEAENAARVSLEARIKFWDGVVKQLEFNSSAQQ